MHSTKWYCDNFIFHCLTLGTTNSTNIMRATQEDVTVKDCVPRTPKFLQCT